MGRRHRGEVSCGDVGRVALDPSPEMGDEDAIDLVSVGRKGFVDSLLPGGEHLRFDDPEKVGRALSGSPACPAGEPKGGAPWEG